MARYRDAVEWLADFDGECVCYADEGEYAPSIYLVASVWSKEPRDVAADVLKAQRKLAMSAALRTDGRNGHTSGGKGGIRTPGTG